MAHSSLLGIDRAPTGAPGHDTASLGPSDTSDSGSDLAGIDPFDDGDAMLPVDVAVAADRPHPDSALDALEGDTDAGGTGERRSAGGDGRVEDGADISPDRIVDHPDAATVEEGMSSLADDEWNDVVDEGDELVALKDAGSSDSEADEEDARVVGDADPSVRPVLRPRTAR